MAVEFSYDIGNKYLQSRTIVVILDQISSTQLLDLIFYHLDFTHKNQNKGYR